MIEGKESLVSQITTYYGTAKADSTPLTPSQKMQLHERPHFREVGEDLSNYVPESTNFDSPFVFFRHSEDPSDRLVRVMSPDSERQDLFVHVQKPPENPQVRQFIQTWAQIQHIVMVNPELLNVVHETLFRYEHRQPLVVEGPPAVSKTFGEWVSACIIEAPYRRMPYSSGVDREYIVGGLQPDLQRKGMYAVRDVLRNDGVLEAIEFLENKRDDLTARVFMRNVRTLFELDQEGCALDDVRVIMAYDQISKIIGMSLIEETKHSFKDTDINLLAEYGGILAMDEVNTIDDDKAYNALLPYVEPDTWNIPMPSQRKKGDILKHPNFFPVAAINPPNEIGRSRLPGPFASRTDRVVLRGVTPEYIKQILTFYMTGNDADLLIGGKRIPGRKNVRTRYRALEVMPYRDAVINSVAHIHATISEMKLNKDLGVNWREGGEVVTDQRKITSVADKMITVLGNMHRIDSNGRIQPDNVDWVKVVKNSLRGVFLDGTVQSRDRKSDYAKISALIEGQPIWRALEGASKGASGSMMKQVNIGGKKGHVPEI